MVLLIRYDDNHLIIVKNKVYSYRYNLFKSMVTFFIVTLKTYMLLVSMVKIYDFSTS